MSRFVFRLRGIAIAVISTMFVAAGLVIPAHASDGPDMRDISVYRVDATDQFFMSTRAQATTVRFDYSDPVYGPQTVTLTTTPQVPVATNDAAPMCAVAADANPTPTITVTFNPDTPSAVTKIVSYYPSSASSTYTLDYFQQDVTKKAAAVAVTKQWVVKAKASVKKARALLMRAKASHRTTWIASASRWLEKSRARLVARKAKLVTRKTELAGAKESLRTFQEYTAYCQERRLN